MEPFWRDILSAVLLSAFFSVQLAQDSPRDRERLLEREQKIMDLEARIRTLEEYLRNEIA